MERWMEKEDVIYIYTHIDIYIYNGILFSRKKKWNNAIYRNMDGPRDYHTKWSKPDRKRQMSYDIAYMRYLKKKLSVQMNLFTKQKETHRYKNHTYG